MANVTHQVIDISGFRSIVAHMDETAEWLNHVGERESVFRRMMDDARVSSLVEERKNKVLQMYGSLTATGNNLVDTACEKYLTFNLFYQLNKIILNAIPYGIACCENLWVRKNGLTIPYAFLPIPRDAISFPNKYDVPYGVPVLSSLNIPLGDSAKFTVHRNDDGNGDVWGRPALRSAYWGWRFKRLGLKFWALAAEKIGAPSILAIFETRTDTEAKERGKLLTEALQSWTSGSSGALGNVKDIKIVDSTIQDFNTLIQTCNAEIAMALTAQTLTTNESQYGTKAQATTHVETFDSIIKGDCYQLQQTCQKLVNAFVEINFPGETAPTYDIDSSDFASWDIIREAIDRGVPVSLSALYKKVHLPKPTDEKDSFLKPANSMMFSDKANADFFFRTRS